MMADIEPKLEITTKVTAEKTERRDMSELGETVKRATHTDTLNLTFEKTITGEIEVASAIFYLMEDSESYVWNKVIPAAIQRHGDSEYDVSRSEDPYTVEIEFHGCLKPMYRAARHTAYESTKNSMVQQGYSDGMILAKWFKRGEQILNPEGVASSFEIEPYRFEETVREALNKYGLKHRQGSPEIEGEIPEAEGELERSEMLPDMD